MKKILLGILVLAGLCLVGNSHAAGYTGNEVHHTQIYGQNDVVVGITLVRRYQQGFFVEGEFFNDRNSLFGVGYQFGDQSSLMDIRINKDNTKIVLMKRF